MELKNGAYLRGLILEVDPSSHLTLKLPSGELRKIPILDVASAERSGKPLKLSGAAESVPAAPAAAAAAPPAPQAAAPAPPPSRGNRPTARRHSRAAGQTLDRFERKRVSRARNRSIELDPRRLPPGLPNPLQARAPGAQSHPISNRRRAHRSDGMVQAPEQRLPHPGRPRERHLEALATRLARRRHGARPGRRRDDPQATPSPTAPRPCETWELVWQPAVGCSWRLPGCSTWCARRSDSQHRAREMIARLSAAFSICLLPSGCIRVPPSVASEFCAQSPRLSHFLQAATRARPEMLYAATSEGRKERIGRGRRTMRSLSRRDFVSLALPRRCPSAAPPRGLRYSTRAVYMDPTRATPGRLPFETGQILLSEAPGPHGILFTLAPNRFFRFTHAAMMLVNERGEPYVYDVSAAFSPSFATTPTGSLDGGVRKTPLTSYIGANLYVEVFDPPAGVDRERMHRKILDIEASGVEFDPHWDFSSNNKLFCTEFMVEVLAAGGAPRPPLVGLTRNQSLRRVLAWFGVTAVNSLPAAALPREKLVAAFSRWSTRGAAGAYLEAKRELYLRFTPDQNIGDLLELVGLDVRMRPPVEAFLERAPALYASEKGEPKEPENPYASPKSRRRGARPLPAIRTWVKATEARNTRRRVRSGPSPCARRSESHLRARQGPSARRGVVRRDLVLGPPPPLRRGCHRHRRRRFSRLDDGGRPGRARARASPANSAGTRSHRACSRRSAATCGSISSRTPVTTSRSAARSRACCSPTTSSPIPTNLASTSSPRAATSCCSAATRRTRSRPRRKSRTA